VPRDLAKRLFAFLRTELPFYRVEYSIKRGGVETRVRTPRWTTVFGIDETSRFATHHPLPPASDDNDTTTTSHDEDDTIVDSTTRLPVTHHPIYTSRRPRPIPQCLDVLRRSVEEATGCVFNFCLVNYYASGADSISFHSDDERFLGPEPAIASFSLGARRDFLMKHKMPVVVDEEKKEHDVEKEKEKEKEEEKEKEKQNREKVAKAAATTLKFPLASGDMVLMRGRTQANWLHSIPKRSGRNLDDGGRINITFRRAVVKGGTDNYYTYNVGRGPVYRWDDVAGEFRVEEKDKTKVAA
jgi:hypothetical protein